MGNMCGKPDPDPFSQPGRVLGAAPPQAKTGPVPPAIKKSPTVGGPPRTLGGGAPSSSSPGDGDARNRAAAAAEARAKGTKTGKLGDALQQQRKQTRTDTLKEVSTDAVRRREMDAANEARSYN